MISKGIESEVEKKLLYKAIEKLNQREKVIVEMRYGLNNKDGEEMTQKEVADSLGISQSYISSFVLLFFRKYINISFSIHLEA